MGNLLKKNLKNTEQATALKKGYMDVPEFDIYGNVKYRKKDKNSERKFYIFFAVALVLTIIISIWLPAWIGMLKNDSTNNKLYGKIFEVSNDFQETDYIRRFCINADNTDFDGDGVTNSAELELGINPFKSDTDNDGLTDGVEIKENTDVKNKDEGLIDLIKKADKSNNKTIEMPYLINDTVAWADDYKTKAYSSVTQIMNDYYIISDFQGYLNFGKPNSTAYIINNGYFEELEYIDSSDAYRIDVSEPTYVQISEKKKKFVTKFTIFSKEKEIENKKIGKLIQFLLPENNSWICAKKVAKENFNKKIESYAEKIVTSFDFPKVEGLEDKMLSKCSYNLEVIKAVYDAIDNNQTVSCCIFNNEGYEVVFVYGYDNFGGLLVCDGNCNKLGSIPIVPKSKFVYDGNELKQEDCFDFDIKNKNNSWNISFFSLS